MPLSCWLFVERRRLWQGHPCLPPGGYTCRPEWSRFTVWEIRGAAADKGISRPSGAVRAGGSHQLPATLHAALDRETHGGCGDKAEITTPARVDISPNVCGWM